MSEDAARASLLTQLKGRVRSAHFRPGWVGVLTNPFYFARSGLHRALERVAPRVGGRMLDVGCGRKPYAHLFRVSEHVGLELDEPSTRASGSADAYYDGRRFPFEDASFDTVFASQVFEHVFQPTLFLEEAGRVLRPGGRLLLTMPFLWDEHEQPRDFARYSSFGISHLLNEHGFRVVLLEKSGADVSAVLQAWGLYAYKSLAPGAGARKLAVAGLLTLPVNIAGIVLRPLLPENPDLFLDLVVLAEKSARGSTGP